MLATLMGKQVKDVVRNPSSQSLMEENERLRRKNEDQARQLKEFGQQHAAQVAEMARQMAEMARQNAEQAKLIEELRKASTKWRFSFLSFFLSSFSTNTLLVKESPIPECPFLPFHLPASQITQFSGQSTAIYFPERQNHSVDSLT